MALGNNGGGMFERAVNWAANNGFPGFNDPSAGNDAAWRPVLPAASALSGECLVDAARLRPEAVYKCAASCGGQVCQVAVTVDKLGNRRRSTNYPCLRSVLSGITPPDLPPAA